MPNTQSTKELAYNAVYEDDVTKLENALKSGYQDQYGLLLEAVYHENSHKHESASKCQLYVSNIIETDIKKAIAQGKSTIHVLEKEMPIAFAAVRLDNAELLEHIMQDPKFDINATWENMSLVYYADEALKTAHNLFNYQYSHAFRTEKSVQRDSKYEEHFESKCKVAIAKKILESKFPALDLTYCDHKKTYHAGEQFDTTSIAFSPHSDYLLDNKNFDKEFEKRCEFIAPGSPYHERLVNLQNITVGVSSNIEEGIKDALDQEKKNVKKELQKDIETIQKHRQLKEKSSSGVIIVADKNQLKTLKAMAKPLSTMFEPIKLKKQKNTYFLSTESLMLLVSPSLKAKHILNELLDTVIEMTGDMKRTGQCEIGLSEKGELVHGTIAKNYKEAFALKKLLFSDIEGEVLCEPTVGKAWSIAITEKTLLANAEQLTKLAWSDKLCNKALKMPNILSALALAQEFAKVYPTVQKPENRAAAREDFKAVLQALPQKDLNKAIDDYNASPLHYAAGIGDAETVRKLVENGANVTKADQYGATALHCLFVSYHNPQEVKTIADILVQHGANPNAKITGKKETPASMAKAKGYDNLFPDISEIGKCQISSAAFQSSKQRL